MTSEDDAAAAQRAKEDAQQPIGSPDTPVEIDAQGTMLSGDDDFSTPLALFPDNRIQVNTRLRFTQCWT